ncbi:alkaline phosphatase family protein [Paracidobacterium acidisoli]|nr:ectonucleotide pyrophosphatase/phosphodiesterase [Paracidobacterium acidisoli]MBT9331526.1 ectonucleotide pyrophosphatase/phosphodiesterase [Paracidobacterium acidisoli]
MFLFQSLRLLRRVCAIALPGLVGCLLAQGQSARTPVIMISIDGLNPHYVLRAEDHAAGIPFLRSFLTNGTYAQSVINVVPTITFPNHVTLITGTLPEQHGIFNNMLQDPNSNLIAAPMEYGNAIRVPTLWEAAQSAGLKTASVFWPVSLGARGIDYNIPPIHTQGTPADHYLLEAVSRPDGFLASVEKQIGVYSPEEDEDDFVTRAAIAVIRGQRPYLLTVHLGNLDDAQHHSGPDSQEAFAALEKIDGQVRQIADAERAVYPDADIVIVSDHGFFPVSHVINLNAEFVRHGLITLSKTGHIASWKVFSWTGGGSAAVILHNPDDRETAEKVRQILDGLEKDPASGIAQILSKQEAKAFGGTPETEFLIDCRPGFYVGRGLTTPLITDASQKGTHGYLPVHPELQSSFFIMGPRIARNRNLGVIDMRQIAPTIAKELEARMPSATMPVLPVDR